MSGGVDPAAALGRVLAGDRNGFEDLYRVYAGPLLSFLATQVRRTEDAEDLVGQVFLEAMRGIDRFEGDAAAFRAWLFRIGRDRATDLGRRQSRRPEEPLEAAGDAPAEQGTEEQALAALERRRVWEAVAALPDAQREVIALRLGSGLSSGEIAEVVGKDVNAIKALQHRALGNLAKTLGKQMPQIPPTSGPSPYPPAVPRRLEG
ncbi:MAG TPA: sigma-70 family RNA polymerase sigma factor [Actinomycetota bacterium]|nr:sigma-70 family RNA polymerase sigma factor [Actinomycetota bacterium]